MFLLHSKFVALWLLTQYFLRSPQLSSAFHLLPTNDSRNLFLLQLQEQAWKENRLQIFVPDDLAMLSISKRKILLSSFGKCFKIIEISEAGNQYVVLQSFTYHKICNCQMIADFFKSAEHSLLAIEKQ